VPLKFDLGGKTYDPVEVTVDADEIAVYAAASGDPNPAHQAGPDQVAPAVFPVVPVFRHMMSIGADPELGVDNPGMIVHGEQRFVYHRPIRPGDRLVLHPSLDRVEDKGKHGVYVTKVAAATVNGEPVVDQWATIVVRGAGSGASRPASGEGPASEEGPASRGAEAARFTRTVAPDMPARYAAASGDHNPIHLDDTFARSVGLPGVINHGLGTLSLVAGGLVEALAGGDVTHLRELAVRFTAMVVPGDELTTTVWDTPGLSGRGYLFETARADGTVVITGSLTLGGG
jgi:acyl dehydratase